jgi:GGDEF domain-containing protein
MRIQAALANLLGVTRRIEDLEQRVRELSWDAPFGMWTRNAFRQFCRVMPRSRRSVAFVDLENIHALNGRLGYAEVDRRIRTSFAIPFRSSDIVARWYSGDEIVILFDSDAAGAERKLGELRESAAAQDLASASAVGSWEVGRQNIEDVISVLAAQAAASRGRPPGRAREVGA